MIFLDRLPTGGRTLARPRPKHGKSRYRDYPLRAFSAAAKAGSATRITVDVPSFRA
jgi:hypothetical protein